MKFLCFLLLCPALTFAQAPDITASTRWQRMPFDTTRAHQHYLRADSLKQAYYHDSASVFFHRAAAGYYGAGAWGRYVRCLNRQAYCRYKTGHYGASLALAQYALRFSTDSLGEYHTETAEAYTGVGDGYYGKGLYDSSLFHYEEALAIRTNLFGKSHSKIASSLIDLGGVFCTKAKYAEAKKYYTKALQILSSTCSKQNKLASRLYNRIGNVFYYEDKFDSALVYYTKAAKVDSVVYGATHPALATVRMNIGLVYHCNYSYDSALIIFQECLETYRRIDSAHHELAWVYESIGEVYRERDMYNIALSYHQKALSLLQEQGEVGVERHYIYLNIGRILYDVGAYDLALEYYKKYLNATDTLVMDPVLASTYNMLSYIFLEKGEYHLAIRYARKSLDVRNSGYSKRYPHLSLSYHNLGLVYYRLKDYDKAIEYQRKAIKTWKKRDDTHAYFCQVIGDAYKAQGKHKLAKNFYQEAVKSYISVDAKGVGLAELYGNLASACQELDHYQLALYYYQQSILTNTLKSESDSSSLLVEGYRNASYLLTALHGKASTFEARYQQRHQLHDLLAALHHYQACDSLIATMQHQYLKHGDRVAFGKTAKQVYEGAVRVSLLLAQNSPRTLAVGAYPSSGRMWPFEKQGAAGPYASLAFYFAERAKAGALTLALADRRAKHFSGVPDSLLEQEKYLKQERSFYRTQHHEAQNAKDDRRQRQYEDRLFALNRRYDSLVGALEQQYPRYHQLKYTTTVRRPREVQRRLDQRTAFLEYVISDTVGYVFSMTRHRDTVHTFPVDSTLHRQLRRVASAPDSSQATDDSYAESAYGVYRRVLSDALASLPASVDRLVIVPDGRLSYVPFDVLLTTPVRHRDYRRWPYLLRRYAVSYAYSATLQWPEEPAAGPSEPYTARLPGRSGESPRLLALAPAYEEVQHDTVAQRALGAWRDAVVPLTWNRHEVEGLRQYLPGTFIAGGKAQEATFKQRAADYDVVHLAAHALLDDADPMQSQLVFSAATDSTEDGFLHAYELYGMDLPARLAVLSACRTGTGQLAEGEGLLSLARAFAYAGCPSVIMNGWAAHDATTARIMDRLYYYLADGYHKADALRQAKLDFLDQATAHTQLPSYWGGWMVVGDTTPLVSASSRDGWPWLVMMAIALAGGLGGWWWKHGRYRTAGIRKNR